MSTENHIGDANKKVSDNPDDSGVEDRSLVRRFAGQCIPFCEEFEDGQALVSTLTGEEDDLGGCVTLSPGGPGKMVSVKKCPVCGFSFRAPNSHP